MEIHSCQENELGEVVARVEFMLDQSASSSNSTCKRGRVAAAVRDGKHDFPNTPLASDLSSFAVHFQRWGSGRFIDDFDVCPLNSFCPACSKHF